MPTTFNFRELTLREQAAVTLDDLQSKFLAYDLMVEGIVKTPLPDLLPIPECPAYEARTIYEILKNGSSTGIFIENPADFDAFLALKPGTCQENWYLNHYAEIDVRGIDNDAKRWSLKSVNGTSAESHKMLGTWVDEVKKAKEKNAEMEKEYTRATENTLLVRARLEECARIARDKARRFESILARRDEYTAMAGGNGTVALKFLEKAFSGAEIRDALAYEMVPNFPGIENEPLVEMAAPAGPEDHGTMDVIF